MTQKFLVRRAVIFDLRSCEVAIIHCTDKNETSRSPKKFQCSFKIPKFYLNPSGIFGDVTYERMDDLPIFLSYNTLYLLTRNSHYGYDVMTEGQETVEVVSVYYFARVCDGVR